MKDSFLKLITDYQRIVLKVCSMYCTAKEDKDDLFQEIVLQLWRSYAGFKGDSKISTWMYRIAINTAITGIRKTSRRQKFTELDDVSLSVPEEPDHQAEQFARMHNSIKKLTEVERAITLLYMDNHSYAEIAEIVGISESNVGFKLNKIKQKLRKLVNTE